MLVPVVCLVLSLVSLPLYWMVCCSYVVVDLVLVLSLFVSDVMVLRLLNGTCVNCLCSTYVCEVPWCYECLVRSRWCLNWVCSWLSQLTGASFPPAGAGDVAADSFCVGS